MLLLLLGGVALIAYILLKLLCLSHHPYSCVLSENLNKLQGVYSVSLYYATIRTEVLVERMFASIPYPSDANSMLALEKTTT